MPLIESTQPGQGSQALKGPIGPKGGDAPTIQTVRLLRSRENPKNTGTLEYNGSPWRLLLHDIGSFFAHALMVPGIVVPLLSAHPLDELYFRDPQNLLALGVHSFLIVAQLSFLISIPFLTWLPFVLLSGYILSFLALNRLVCFIFLNRGLDGNRLMSTRPDQEKAPYPDRSDEKWIFLNGVAVGKHWLQNNIDMISRIFRRDVEGVHNETGGIIFDVIECLIQRCLYYGPNDVRVCYRLIKQAIDDPAKKKVVLIVHSQGGLIGAIMVDWFLAQLKPNKLAKLEIYTFGNAANHFNNPLSLCDKKSDSKKAEDKASDKSANEKTAKTGKNRDNRKRVIGHIEHYANWQDFVSRWGVLDFKMQAADQEEMKTVFHGSTFLNYGQGHLLNQHYLSPMFPFDHTGHKVRDPPGYGDYFDLPLSTAKNDQYGNPIMMMQEGGSLATKNTIRVYEKSRLWSYVNGKTPNMNETAKVLQECGLNNPSEDGTGGSNSITQANGVNVAAGKNPDV